MPRNVGHRMPWWRSLPPPSNPRTRILGLERLEARDCPALTLVAGANVNISLMRDIQVEPTIAINPVTPAKLFTASVNFAKGIAGSGLFASYTTNGGAAGGWTSRMMATGLTGGDSLPAARGDPQATFDSFGNLFLTYFAEPKMQSGSASGGGANSLTDATRAWAVGEWAGQKLTITGGTGVGQFQTIMANTATQITVNAAWGTAPDNTSTYEIDQPDDKYSIVVVRSANSGQSFSFLARLDAGEGPPIGTIDQPSIATGSGGTVAAGSVWVAWTDSVGTFSLAGAPVTGLNAVGTFGVNEHADPSNMKTFGSIAVGPIGQVLVTFQDNTTIYSYQDPDGLGPLAPLMATRIVTTENVGLQLILPATENKGIDSNSHLAWDNSGKVHGGPNGRLYVVYTDVAASGIPNTDIYVRYSDDSGATWSNRVKANDISSNSRFWPSIAVDQTTGYVAVSWYDARNDNNNFTAQIYASASDDGGNTFGVNSPIGTKRSSAIDGDGSQKGTSTGGNGATTLNDGLQTWGPNYWVGQTVVISGGAGLGQSRTITANTATKLTVGAAWGVVPNNTSTYEIGTLVKFDFGDYTGLVYTNGILYPVWSDNSNSTNNNPDGVFRAMDIYTSKVVVAKAIGVPGSPISSQQETPSTPAGDPTDSSLPTSSLMTQGLIDVPSETFNQILSLLERQITALNTPTSISLNPVQEDSPETFSRAHFDTISDILFGSLLGRTSRNSHDGIDLLIQKVVTSRSSLFDGLVELE